MKKYLSLIFLLFMAVSLTSCDIIDQLGVKYSDEYTYNETHHWREAIDSDTDKVKGYNTHQFQDWEYIAVATLTEEGTRKKTCSVCGYSVTEAYTHSHEYSSYELVTTPTQTTTGLIRRKCDYGGYSHKDEYTLPNLLDSRYTKEEILKPTLLENGIVKYTYKDSNVTYSFTIEAINLDHNFIVSKKVKATNELYGFGYSTYICQDLDCSFSFNGGLSYNINNLYGYNYFKNNNTLMAELYEKMTIACEAISNENLNPTTLNVNGSSLTIYNLSKVSFNGLSSEDAIKVWGVFYNENPWYYWLDNRVIYSSKEIYINVNEDYKDYSVRREIESDLLLLEATVSQEILDSMDDYTKIKTIHDYIAKKIDYAYITGTTTPTDEHWAHSLVGILEYDAGVCECYAKAFYYLCSLFDIKCIMVSGESQNVGHAWNYVCINDRWYGVDVTWDDQSYAVITKYLCATKYIMDKDHTINTIDSEGVYFQYPLPELTNIPIIK